MDNKGSFKGRRAVVMGGSRGIGRAAALMFAREGAAVAICARSKGALDATRREIEAFGVPCFARRADLSRADDIASFVPEAAAALGGIGILVNNASGFGASNDEASWDASVSVDLMAVVRATEAALPFLEHASDGAVVNVSSIAAMRATTRNPAYGAIKAASIHLTGSQARTLAPRGIRVNAVAPGSIEFEGGTWERRRTENKALYDATLAQIPFGRFGTPDEVAEAILFLSSQKARWITGQTLVVDGGQLLGP